MHDTQALVAAIRDGLRPKYLFFWGHTPGKSGHLGKECLSQWYPAVFAVDGVTYATAEHFMMAEKARLFGDEEARERILAAAHPSIAQNGSREVQSTSQSQYINHLLIRSMALFTATIGLKI